MSQLQDARSSLNEPDEARFFYLRQEFRRVSLWGIGGCVAAVAMIGTAWSLGCAPRQNDPGGNALSLAGFAAGAVWLTQYLLPRVRVDGRGIRRRFLWWWSAPWSREAFRSERVHEEGGRHRYRLEGRPWWRGGRMHIYFLELKDAEWIRDWIERAGMSFPEPPVPEELNIRFDWPDSRKVDMTSSGIMIRKRRTEIRYQWSDVDRVEIWRMTSDWRGFVELKIVFDDHTLSFERPATIEPRPEYERWRGASSAIISTMVRHHVDRARIRDYSLHGEPRSFDELNARHAREVARWEDYVQAIKQILYVMWTIVALSILVLPWMDSWPQGVAMVVMALLMALGTHWLYRNDRGKLGRLRE